MISERKIVRKKKDCTTTNIILSVTRRRGVKILGARRVQSAEAVLLGSEDATLLRGRKGWWGLYPCTETSLPRLMAFPIMYRVIGN